MSKQIAQTVGDKRIGWLLAIIAAFTMLAILATQWNNARANVDGTEFVVTDDGDGTLAPGETITYSITWTDLLADHVGSTTISGVLDSDLKITSLTQATGPQPDCSGLGTSSFSCTYSSPLTTGSDGTLEVVAELQGTAIDGASLDAADVVVDDESAQPEQAADVSGLTATTEENAAITIDKSDSPDPVTPGNNVTYTIDLDNTGAVAATVGVTDTLPSNAIASIVSATTTSGSCSVSTLTVTCSSIALAATNGTATVTIVATTKANPGVPTFSNTATFTSTVNGLTGPSDSDTESTGFVNGAGTNLVHLTGPLTAGVPETGVRDHENDVIGYRHTVCALNDWVDGLWPNVGPGSPNSSDNFQIQTISGTATIEAPVVTPGVDCDHDGFNDDSTLSWYSVATGEQNIIVVNDAGSTQYGYSGTLTTTVPLVKEWNTLAPTWITSSSTSPVAQAGTLTPSNAADVLVGTNLDGTSISASTTFNAATGVYQGSTGTYYEYPIATHTNAAGTQLYIAYGAQVTITRSTASTCGAVVLGGTNGIDYIIVSGSSPLDDSTDKLVLQSLGKGIPFSFSSYAGAVNDCTSTTGLTKVNIQVDYPTLLGSDQPPAPALETLTVNWSGAIASKQVFLAWSGQRIILEHDWRLPAGDTDGGVDDNDPDPLGSCIFEGSEVPVLYIKGGGGGNFLPTDNGEINGSDQITVYMNANDDSQTDGEDIVGNANGMCISRALFEYEGEGQVDIEAFVDYEQAQTAQVSTAELNSTKVAFVIYYMKINTINVSLVTQLSKPSHNSSAVPDYSPGNPWDASKDDADNAADWNVSKDLLVRGRVTGWFTNENPSGRAADTSNPLNVLPADRWVMPNDWPLLAGGPADPADGTDAIGTAEQFRPYYDLMFSPNNTRGIALGNPTGTNRVLVTTVVSVPASYTNSAASFLVASCGDFAGVPVGAGLVIGSSAASFGACTSGVLFVSGLASTPAAGTLVYINSGAPFEGPYSTVDIIGLASQGLGGAALSDFDPNNIRDAALDDGDVDWWDAPMPVAPVSVAIRGTGFIKQVLKQDVYYNGAASSTNSIAAQTFPNPYYITDIPASPFLPAVVAGGGTLWDTWSNDGPGGLGDGVYEFWEPAVIGANSQGFGDSLSSAQAKELQAIRDAYGDQTIARDLVVFSDNHGEFMVTANGDFKTDLTACTTNVLAGGKHCAPGDHVGTGTITATVDYPDFTGKHFPVLSNAATVTWTWGGYKDVTIEAGETDQFKYVVFHGMDRDGFCYPLAPGVELLHPLLSGADNDTFNGNPAETVDFLIDSGEGIIIGSALNGTINDGKQFATGVKTFSTYANDPATTGIKEFPLSSLAASGATDECQAWIKVSNSLLGVLNVLAIAHDDEGNIGFDKIIDLTNTTSYTLNFRWSLITWAGADAISVNDAIKGTGTSGANPGGNDISASVTAIYGWDAAAQQWLGYFPSGVNVPGANDLTSLKTGQAYWIAITGPSSVTWTIASNVN
ncbi:MAG: hypothetical protein AB7J35_17700 [Dehalococcoidia bacterium]